MLGFEDISKATQLYKALQKKIAADDWRTALVEITRARALSIASKALESYQVLKASFGMIFSPNSIVAASGFQSEVSALYIYIYTVLVSKFGRNIINIPLLQAGGHTTSIKKFQLAFKYFLTFNQVQSGFLSLQHLISIVKQVENDGMYILACVGYLTAGKISLSSRDFEKTHEFYRKALNLAFDHIITSIRNRIYLTQVNAYILEGNSKLAKELILKVKLSQKYDPIAAALLDNYALLAEGDGNMDQAVDFVKEATVISAKLDSAIRLPGECLYLGDALLKHFNDREQAEHYYRLGYERSLKYAHAGIALTGERYEVVQAYTNFLDQQHKPSVTTPGPVEPFKFAAGKTWQEIRDIFQHQLIRHHLTITKNSKQLARKLSMPPSTLYSLQHRLLARGYSLTETDQTADQPLNTLHTFIQDHEELTWTEVNTIFEREIMHYLYEKYGYNKYRMASILKLSYPTILNKTRDLTRVPEHFLPN